MNRAQRRAAAKPLRLPARMPFDKFEGYVQQHATLMSARTNDLPVAAQQRILLSAYAAATALEQGIGSDEHFVMLIKWNLHGRLLAQRLHDKGNMPDAFKPTEPVFSGAALVMEAIGARKELGGTYSATPEEMQAIRESISTLGELLALSPEGHAVAALAEADRLTRAALRHLHR